MTEISEEKPVLKRMGDNVKKYKLLLLDKNEVTIGRSPDVTFPILSNMISRNHATLRKEPTGWTITDNKSLNGICINSKKQKPGVPSSLKNGDLIQLGVAKSGEFNPEFLFQFLSAVKVKRTRPKSSDETDGCDDHCHKRKKMCSTATTKGDARENCATADDLSESTPSSPSNKQWSPYRKYKESLSEHENQSERKMKEYEQKLAEMQKLLMDKESDQAKMKQELEQEKQKRQCQSKLVTDLKNKEEQMKREFVKKQENLLKEKKEAEEKIREELIRQLQHKEQMLVNQLHEQQGRLKAEKEHIEKRLQEEMEKALQEKDQLLENELLKEKEKLDKIITHKELEKKMLESQLNETKEENTKQKEEMLRSREDVLSNFADLMETELQCSICNELFIKATSLNCSHSYCSMCIEEWMKVKKECPVCRAAITTHMRSIVLDSYIDRMVEHFSDDLKERRKELIESRKKEEEKQAAEKAKASTSTAGRGRARGGRRGGARGRGRGRAQAPAPVPPAPVIVPNPILVESDSEDDEFSDDSLINHVINSYEESVSDSDSDSNDYSDSDSDSPGYRNGAWFGGYGRCYSCGERGHWANGCPYR